MADGAATATMTLDIDTYHENQIVNAVRERVCAAPKVDGPS